MSENTNGIFMDTKILCKSKLLTQHKGQTKSFFSLSLSIYKEMKAHLYQAE